MFSVLTMYSKIRHHKVLPSPAELKLFGAEVGALDAMVSPPVHSLCGYNPEQPTETP